ncbi:MAG: hypothetical protein QME94_07775 [Anaerolineae bacterium]|nr:hypothetical protein [Anaerolineae bacterium]
MNEPLRVDAIERALEGYYRAETSHLSIGPRLWQELERRIPSMEPPPRQTYAPVRAGERRTWTRAAIRIAAAGVLAAAALVIVVANRGPRMPVGTARLVGPSAVTTLPEVTPVSPGSTAVTHPPTAAVPPTQPEIVQEPGAALTPSGPVSASPTLRQGTLEEAQEATGLTILLPRYLPEGAVREHELVFYQVMPESAMASLSYRVGQGYLALEFIRASGQPLLSLEGEAVTVGSFEGRIHTQPREPSDPLPPITGVAWLDGDVLVRVTGDLAADELLKVARSLY